MWQQALHAEAALCSGYVTAAALLDLAKAFESVRLDLIWAAGIRLGFPKAMLRLVLCTFTATRVLRLDSAIADGIRSWNAICAGSTYGCDCMLLIFIAPVDRLSKQMPALQIGLVVDDLSLQVSGDAAAVRRTLVAATGDVIASFEAMGLVVSRGEEWLPSGKTVITASSSATRKSMQIAAKAHGVNVQATARHLGIDYSAGAKRGARPVWAARGKNAKHKTKRLGVLCGVRRAQGLVVRGSVLPGRAYGCGVSGLTITDAEGMAKLMHAALGPVKGRSRFARLFLSGGFPSARHALAPLEEWSRAAFDRCVPMEIMRQAWVQACTVVAKAASSRPAGPAAALIDIVHKVGWVMQDPWTVIEANGQRLDMRCEAPRTVLKAAHEAYVFWLASNSSLAQQVQGVPDLRALRSFMAAKKRKDTDLALSLRSLAEGAWVTQHQLYMWDLADTPACQACGHPKGDLAHRLAGCDAWSDKVPELKGRTKDVVQLARGACAIENPLFYRGVPRMTLATRCQRCGSEFDALKHANGMQRQDLPNDWRCGCGAEARHLKDSEWPKVVKQPPRAVGPGALAISHGDLRFSGDVFLDGSMHNGQPDGARRSGFSAVQVGPSAKAQAALYGACGDRCPTAYRAEVRSVYEVLRRADGPLRLFLDCLSVVQTLLAGKGAECAASAAAPDLWRAIWILWDDRSGIDTVQWCRAHTTQRDLLEGKTTWWQQAANDLADTFAKRGAAFDAKGRSSDNCVSDFKAAKSWYGWVASLAAQWVQDTAPRDRHSAQDAPHDSVSPSPQPPPVPAVDTCQRHDEAEHERDGDDGQVGPHQLWNDGGTYFCVRCGARARAKAAIAKLKKQTCKPAPVFLKPKCSYDLRCETDAATGDDGGEGASPLASTPNFGHEPEPQRTGFAALVAGRTDLSSILVDEPAHEGQDDAQATTARADTGAVAGGQEAHGDPGRDQKRPPWTILDLASALCSRQTNPGDTATAKNQDLPMTPRVTAGQWGRDDRLSASKGKKRAACASQGLSHSARRPRVLSTASLGSDTKQPVQDEEPADEHSGTAKRQPGLPAAAACAAIAAVAAAAAGAGGPDGGPGHRSPNPAAGEKGAGRGRKRPADEVAGCITAKRAAGLPSRGAVPVGSAGPIDIGAAFDPLNDLPQNSVAEDLAGRLLGAGWRDRVHHTHHLALIGNGGDMLFCRTCGCNATSMQHAPGLTAICDGLPVTPNPQLYRLRKLLEGRHPARGTFIGGGTVRTLGRQALGGLTDAEVSSGAPRESSNLKHGSGPTGE